MITKRVKVLSLGKFKCRFCLEFSERMRIVICNYISALVKFKSRFFYLLLSKNPITFVCAASGHNPCSTDHDTFNRSCQTDETTYVSCEICHRTQACLYDVGK